MAQAHTVENLLDAIRNAESLAELQRLAGPSEAERLAAEQRISKMDVIAEKCEFESLAPSHEAIQARESYDKVAAIQAEYEHRYC